MRKKFLNGVVVGVLSLIVNGCTSMNNKNNDALYSYLSAFEQKMKAGEHLNVAFLGGSITWGACASDQGKTSYRALVSKYLKKTYPEAHLKFWDAAIGGTPSKLGVFRMDRDVLPYKPDLTFIEFAVNDNEIPESLETMEGIIRKLKNSNPEMVVFIIILGAGRKGKYGTSKHLEHIKLANYYGLPYADVCGPVKKAIKAGEINTDLILADGCHPNDAGYKIYADIIIENLKKAFLAKGKATIYPKPLTANQYESAKMLELSTLDNLGDWKSAEASTLGTWYDHQPSRWISSIIIPKKDNAKIDIKLKCSGIGLYYEIYKDAGKVIVKVDDKKLLNISTDMPLHYNRLAWTFKLLPKLETQNIKLIADKKEKVKAAYILYTTD